MFFRNLNHTYLLFDIAIRWEWVNLSSSLSPSFLRRSEFIVWRLVPRMCEMRAFLEASLPFHLCSLYTSQNLSRLFHSRDLVNLYAVYDLCEPLRRKNSFSNEWRKAAPEEGERTLERFRELRRNKNSFVR